jgi:hypothetical protein
MNSGPSALIYHGGGNSQGAGFPAPGGSVLDEKVKITTNDTTPNFLDSKIALNGRLSKTTLNPAGNEQLEIQGGDHFVLCYNNFDLNLITGDFLRPGDYSIIDGGHCGYYSDSGFQIKKVCMCLHNYASFGSDQVQFRIRSYTADGSKAGVFLTGEGTLIGTVWYNVPNTGGNERYYFGGYDNIDWAVASNQALFIYILSSDVDDIDGVTFWFHCYKYPLT